MRGATPNPLSIDSLLVLKDWKELVVQYLQRKSCLRYRQTDRQTCIGVNVGSKTCSNVSLYLFCDELKHPTTRPGADVGVCPQRHGKSVLQTNQKIRRLKLTRTISSKVCKMSYLSGLGSICCLKSGFVSPITVRRPDTLFYTQGRMGHALQPTILTTCQIPTLSTSKRKLFKLGRIPGLHLNPYNYISQKAGMPIFSRTAEIRFFGTKILTPEIRLNPRR